MENLVFVGSCSGIFYALDRQTGDEVWSYDTGLDGDPAEFHGDPVIADGLVLTGCDRTTLPHTYAFQRFSGMVMWKQARSSFESDLLHVADLVIGRRWNGDLIAMSLQSGEIRWMIPPLDYTYRFGSDLSPIAADGVVYFGGVDGHVYAVDAVDGKTRWQRDLKDALTTSPVTDGRDVYIGSATNRIFRLSASDGDVLAECATAGRPFGRPALTESTVILLEESGSLVAYDRDLATIRWVQEGRPSWSSDQPLLWKDVVVVGTRGGDVLAYRVADGSVELSIAVDGIVRGIGADESTLYVGTLGGVLYAWRLDE